MWFSYSHERYLKSIDGGNLLQLIEKARLQIIFLTFVPLCGSINVRERKIEKKNSHFPLLQPLELGLYGGWFKNYESCPEPHFFFQIAYPPFVLLLCKNSVSACKCTCAYICGLVVVCTLYQVLIVYIMAYL